MNLFRRRRSNSLGEGLSSVGGALQLTGSSQYPAAAASRQSSSRPVSRQQLRREFRPPSPPRPIAIGPSHPTAYFGHHALTPESARQSSTVPGFGFNSANKLDQNAYLTFRSQPIPTNSSSSRSRRASLSSSSPSYSSSGSSAYSSKSHSAMYDHHPPRVLDVNRDYHHGSPVFESYSDRDQKHRPRSYSHGIPPIRAGGAEPTPFPVKPPSNSGGATRPKTPSGGVFSVLRDMARGRSKTRGHPEEKIERPRSRSQSDPERVEHLRGRDGYPDPKYERDVRREKIEAQKRYELELMQSLDNALRIQEADARLHARRGSDATHAMQRHDVPRHGRDQRGRVDPREFYAGSPTLVNTAYNAHQLRMQGMVRMPTEPAIPVRSIPTPDPRTLRRSNTAMANPYGSSAAVDPDFPEGWYNRRGDQVLDRLGREVIMLPLPRQYPKCFAHLPDVGEGWGDRHGQLLSPDMKWIRKIG